MGLKVAAIISLVGIFAPTSSADQTVTKPEIETLAEPVKTAEVVVVKDVQMASITSVELTA